MIEGEIKVYWRPDCKYCELAKALLAAKSLDYTPIEIGVDISRDYFKMVNPEIEKLPAIFIDEIWIGGYTELKNLIAPTEEQ